MIKIILPIVLAAIAMLLIIWPKMSRYLEHRAARKRDLKIILKINEIISRREYDDTI